MLDIAWLGAAGLSLMNSADAAAGTSTRRRVRVNVDGQT
jgi:hypothetical protein